jgi:hypothetical protein
MGTEASRVLTAEGVYIIISYALPDNRLSQEDYGWTVTVHTIENTVGTATPRDPKSCHYIYYSPHGKYMLEHAQPAVHDDRQAQWACNCNQKFNRDERKKRATYIVAASDI